MTQYMQVLQSLKNLSLEFETIQSLKYILLYNLNRHIGSVPMYSTYSILLLGQILKTCSIELSKLGRIQFGIVTIALSHSLHLLSLNLK